MSRFDKLSEAALAGYSDEVEKIADETSVTYGDRIDHLTAKPAVTEAKPEGWFKDMPLKAEGWISKNPKKAVGIAGAAGLALPIVGNALFGRNKD